MMNAELVAARERRIIIPTIYRGSYLSALKAISNRTSAEPLVRMLDFAQRFTRSIDWTDFKRAETELQAANAFMDSNEAEGRGIRLRIPEKAAWAAIRRNLRTQDGEESVACESGAAAVGPYSAFD